MPSYYNNKLTIYNITEEEAAIVQEEFASNRFPNFVVPQPEKFASPDEEYEWCCENWGTKWTATLDKVTYEDGTLCATYDTAWVPFTDNVVAALSARFPSATIAIVGYLGDYSMCGVALGRNGKASSEYLHDQADSILRNSAQSDSGEGQEIYAALELAEEEGDEEAIEEAEENLWEWWEENKGEYLEEIWDSLYSSLITKVEPA